MQNANSKMQIADLDNCVSRWPHRWAVGLAFATFPLLWVGGLVTTTHAGMAVQDWPTTNGYFFYPFFKWLFAAWDFFIEHGHRFLAKSIGMLTIGLLIVLWRCEKRRWMRWLGVVALVLVIFQGVLGGMRVLLDERTLAMLHGMTGPLFFGVTVALTVFTSRTWSSGAAAGPHVTSRGTGPIRLLAIVTAVLAYLQIMLGAVLRHVPIDAQPATFVLAVKFHLMLAGVLTIHIAFLVWFVLRRARDVRPLGRLAGMLATLVVLQLLLGVATWMEKYSVPSWASGWFSHSGMVIRDGAWLQTHIITAHVATGSALFGTTIALALYAHRLLTGPAAVRQAGKARLEAAV
jgi:cytochrome c oxidase assembly protein subunit 15